MSRENKMPKENGCVTSTKPKVITTEQRARISQNYRAAKALLVRKRPRNDAVLSSSPGQNSRESRGAIELPRGVKRFPLAEICPNTPGLLHRNPPKLTDSNSEVTADFRAGRECLENEFSSYDFVTPLKELECPPGLANRFSTSSLLDVDEDFDESILEEIDAVCERASAAKAEKCGATKEDAVDLAGSEPVVSGQSVVTTQGCLGSWGELNLGTEDKDKSETLKFKNMPEEYSKYLCSLNERQQEAACSDISIPLMIVAGPGSGKTSTMVGRVLMLISEGISPSNILAMTFTTAAASEMRDRIGAVAGKSKAKELTISTFHSFSLHLCRMHAEKLGRTPEFLIYGHGQQRRAVIEAVRLVDKEKTDAQNHVVGNGAQCSDGVLSAKNFKDKSKKWQKFVTQAKASGKTPTDCRKMGDELGAAILQNYNDILRSCDALDYHDLISCSVKLLSEFPEVFKDCQESWKAIVVDEFQDTSSMQYSLLRCLASHNHITIVGDDDQSIFSFNGADISGFDSFRQDFKNYKEIRLNRNYRSTRYIVEAASSLIKNNVKRYQIKDVVTDNSSGSKITIKECQNEQAQCAFVVDKILETASEYSSAKISYGNFAILYRRQVSGKMFQSAFRDRKIPFNVHGVAFYRKKRVVVKAIMAMLRTTLPGCDDGPYRHVFKALLPFEKDEKMKVIDHIDKISTSQKCSFIAAASDIFGAKISGTFKRSQLAQGRKVLSTIEMISNLVLREQSISTVITSVANMVPQKYLLEQRAVVDVDGGKFLNEDNDLRSVLQYLLDDVSDFLSHQSGASEEGGIVEEKKGCLNLLKAFVDYTTERERENFQSRRHDNENSVTLTTIHQSKGLEWDTVFIVKANDSEIPLLHEFNGIAKENRTSIEEERRLFYVAMTRARKKLFILYVALDGNWQMLQPSRFLKEIPDHVREIQAEVCLQNLREKNKDNIHKRIVGSASDGRDANRASTANEVPSDCLDIQENEDLDETSELPDVYHGNMFLRRFAVEDRSVVSHLFHQWARKQAFQNPKRLIDKVGFVIDERLRVKKNKHKDVLRTLKSCLNCNEALQYVEYVLRWEKIPADQRAHLMREKQEHFQKLRIENSMSSSAPTSKQIGYLQKLGCTVVPTSRLHASHLIEQYKAL